MKTYETFLPLFNGFYNTVFEPCFDDFEIENNLEYDDYDFDNSAYELDVIDNCIRFLENEIDLIKSIELQKIVSPKYYNYSNDSADVKITVDDKALLNFINENKDFLDDFFNENYSDRPGFWSSYPNSFEGWKVETKNFTELDGHYLGAILNAYCLFNDINDIDMYYFCEVCSETYTTVKNENLENFNEADKKIIALKALENIEPFGYLEILIKESKQKALHFNDKWQNVLVDSYYRYILKEAGVKRVKKETLEIVK